MANYHIPNEAGVTMAQFMAHLKPRGVPVSAICTYFNNGFSLQQAARYAEISYGEKLKPSRRLRRLGLADCQRMMQRAVEGHAATLWDRANGEARKWLFKYLPEKKRAHARLFQVPDNLEDGAAVEMPPDGVSDKLPD